MGTLKLLKNVDLTKDMNNTFTFSTETEQSTFFGGKSVYVKSNVNIQRLKSPYEVKGNAEDLRGVNYLMFQNEDTAKWYYCFVTEVNYISKNVTELVFELDPWQTYYFDLEFEHCYIERQHVADDTIGLHIQDENLDIGDPIIIDTYEPIELRDLTYVLAVTLDYDPSNPDADSQGYVNVVGDEYAGVYSGLKFYASDNITYVNSVIDQLNEDGKADALVAIFMAPKELVPVVNDGVDQAVVPNNGGAFVLDGVSKNLTNLDGYVPKNNKLFTYPYNYLEVDNYSGDRKIYKYEYFTGPDCQFTMISDIAPGTTVYAQPNQYNGETQNQSDFISLGPYPLCVWRFDVYSNWLAQNQVANAVKVGGSAVSFLGGLATGNPVAIAGGALGVASTIGQFKDKSVLPDPSRGSSSGTGAVASGKMNFNFSRLCIRSEYAKVIDDYFTRFGYKVNSLEVPNFEKRPYYDYIKCQEVNVFGDVPRNELERIRQTLLDGITFWHSDNVGDYSLNNTV